MVGIQEPFCTNLRLSNNRLDVLNQVAMKIELQSKLPLAMDPLFVLKI